MLAEADNGSQEPIVHMSSQLRLQWCHTDSLKSAGEISNTTNLLVSSQAAKGVRTFTLVPGKSRLEPI